MALQACSLQVLIARLSRISGSLGGCSDQRYACGAATGAGVQAADAARVRLPYERAVNDARRPVTDIKRMQVRADLRGSGLPGTRAATRAFQDTAGRVAADQRGIFYPRPVRPSNRVISRAVFGAGAAGVVITSAVIVSDLLTANQSDNFTRSITRSLVVNAGGIIGTTIGVAVGVGAGGIPGIFTGMVGGVAGADIAERDVAPVIDDLIWGN